MGNETREFQARQSGNSGAEESGVFGQAVKGPLGRPLTDSRFPNNLAPGAPLCAQGSDPGASTTTRGLSEVLALGSGILQPAQKPHRDLARKYLNWRARDSQILVPRNNCFWATIPGIALGASGIPDVYRE